MQKATLCVTSLLCAPGAPEGIILTPEHLPWYSRPFGIQTSYSPASAPRHLQPRLPRCRPAGRLALPSAFPSLCDFAHTHCYLLPGNPLLLLQWKNPCSWFKTQFKCHFSIEASQCHPDRRLELCRPSALPTPSNRHTSHIVIYFQPPASAEKCLSH